MAVPDRQQKPSIAKTEQEIQNWSFDELYQVMASVMLAEYNGALYRLQVDSSGNLKVTSSGSSADGHVVLAGTEANQKDDANYGDGLTSGVATVHSRVWNGTNYDRDWGQARTKAYAYQAKSDDGTYKYFFFEDASKNYFIMRKNKTTGQAHYAAGTGGYESAYINSTSAPSGSPTWASYGTVF